MVSRVEKRATHGLVQFKGVVYLTALGLEVREVTWLTCSRALFTKYLGPIAFLDTVPRSGK